MLTVKLKINCKTGDTVFLQDTNALTSSELVLVAQMQREAAEVLQSEK